MAEDIQFGLPGKKPKMQWQAGKGFVKSEEAPPPAAPAAMTAKDAKSAMTPAAPAQDEDKPVNLNAAPQDLSKQIDNIVAKSDSNAPVVLARMEKKELPEIIAYDKDGVGETVDMTKFFYDSSYAQKFGENASRILDMYKVKTALAKATMEDNSLDTKYKTYNIPWDPKFSASYKPQPAAPATPPAGIPKMELPKQ